MLLQHLSFLTKEQMLNVKESYWENISKQYERVNWNQDVTAFDNFQKKVIEALAIVDSNLWYVACLSERSIEKYMVKCIVLGFNLLYIPSKATIVPGKMSIILLTKKKA